MANSNPNQHLPILENSDGYRFADAIARGFGYGRRGAERVFNQDPVTSTVVPGALGAGTGYGIGKLVDWYRMKSDSNLPRNLAIALGIGGAALGGYAHHARKSSHVKSAAPFGTDFGGVRDATHEVVMRIRQDQSLSGGQKETLLSALTNLSPDAVQRLKQVIAGLSGAALFAAIMRFAGSGNKGMLGGALAGGMAGLALVGGGERTAQGLRPQRSQIF